MVLRTVSDVQYWSQKNTFHYQDHQASSNFQSLISTMDPLSITASATAFLGICMQTIQLIQRTIETVKNSRSLLVKLLSQTERLRLNLEQLRSLTAQLGTRAGTLLSYNDSAPRQTMKELNELVKKIAENPSYLGIQTLLNKSKVDGLVERLKKHEEEIVTVLLSIAT